VIASQWAGACQLVLAMAVVSGLACKTDDIRTPTAQTASTVTSPATSSKFRLEFATTRLNVFYTYDELVRRAPDSEFSAPAAVVTNADVVSVQTPAPGELMIVLTAEAAERVASLAKSEMRPYRVLLDNKPVLLGATYTEIGAAALRFPVLHYRAAGARPDQNQPTLRLLCEQGFGCSPETAKRIPSGEIQAALQSVK
jgi:hypothetical protein